MSLPVVTRTRRVRRLFAIFATQRYAWLALCAVLLLLPFAPDATSAQAPAAPIRWAVRMADESRCATDDTFLETVQAQIPAEQRAREEDAELVAEIAIADGAARVVVFDRILAAEAGARELPLSTRRCSGIAEAVSLVLGVLVEAGRGALSSEPLLPDAPAPPPPPPPPPPPSPSSPPPEQEPSPPPVRVRPVWRGPPAGHDLNAAVGTLFGLVPAPVLAFTAGWGIRSHSTWPVWLQATGWAHAESDDGLARFSSVHAGILTCPLSGSVAGVRLRACAGLHAGAVWAASRDLVRTESRRRPVALAGLELAASVPLIGPLEFTVLARGDAHLMRSSFFYTTREGGTAYLYDPSVVIGGVFAGFALRFR